MIAQFNRLSSEEQEFMQKAPILVAILIAGADGDIDRSEIREGMIQAEKKQKNSSPAMTALYGQISEDFEDKLKIVLQDYPLEAGLRNERISDELTRLNSIWPKVDQAFAVQYYQSISDLALKIAQSSGGLLGLRSIGAAEAKYVKLPTVTNPANA